MKIKIFHKGYLDPSSGREFKGVVRCVYITELPNLSSHASDRFGKGTPYHVPSATRLFSPILLTLSHLNLTLTKFQPLKWMLRWLYAIFLTCIIIAKLFSQKKIKGEPEFCKGLAHIPLTSLGICAGPGSWLRLVFFHVGKNSQTLFWEVFNSSEINMEYMCSNIATVF